MYQAPSSMDRRLSGHGHGGHGTDVRTPMAWQHRDQLYQQQHSYPQGYQSDMQHSTHSGELYASRCRPPRTASPQDTSNTSSLSSESHSQVRSQLTAQLGAQLPRSMLLDGHHHHAAAAAAASLSTWDGEPCPVHYGPLPSPPGLPPGMPPGMPLGMPPGMPPPPLMMPPGYAIGVPTMMLAAPVPPPPAILLPPMMRPRPLVFPAAPTTPTPPEPLPVREPKSAFASLPPKEAVAPRRKICCRGGCIVLWIIVGLILVGALLATALRFVVP